MANGAPTGAVSAGAVSAELGVKGGMSVGGALDMVSSALGIVGGPAGAAIAMGASQAIKAIGAAAREATAAVISLGSAMGEKTITDFISAISSGGLLGTTSWLVRQLREANDELRRMRYEAQQVLWLTGQIGTNITTAGRLAGETFTLNLLTGIPQAQINQFRMGLASRGIAPGLGVSAEGQDFYSFFSRVFGLGGVTGMSPNEVLQISERLIELQNIRNREQLPELIGYLAARGMGMGFAPNEFISNMMAVLSSTRKFGATISDVADYVAKFGDALQEGRLSISQLSEMFAGAYARGVGFGAPTLPGLTYFAPRLPAEVQERIGLAGVTPAAGGLILQQWLQSAGVEIDEKRQVLRMMMQDIANLAVEQSGLGRLLGGRQVPVESLLQAMRNEGAREAFFQAYGLGARDREVFARFSALLTDLSATFLRVPPAETYEAWADLIIGAIVPEEEKIVGELRGHKTYLQESLLALMNLNDTAEAMKRAQWDSRALLEKIDVVLHIMFMTALYPITQALGNFIPQLKGITEPSAEMARVYTTELNRQLERELRSMGRDDVNAKLFRALIDYNTQMLAWGNRMDEQVRTTNEVLKSAGKGAVIGGITMGSIAGLTAPISPLLPLTTAAEGAMVGAGIGGYMKYRELRPSYNNTYINIYPPNRYTPPVKIAKEYYEASNPKER